MYLLSRQIFGHALQVIYVFAVLPINGLSIGVESGDDKTLALAGKGYTSADILEQCRKLDEAPRTAVARFCL